MFHLGRQMPGRVIHAWQTADVVVSLSRLLRTFLELGPKAGSAVEWEAANSCWVNGAHSHALEHRAAKFFNNTPKFAQHSVRKFLRKSLNIKKNNVREKKEKQISSLINERATSFRGFLCARRSYMFAALCFTRNFCILFCSFYQPESHSKETTKQH